MRQPSDIDYAIARNLKQARTDRLLPLQEVAAMLGISYQQLQKYENGGNRISAGRLWELSQIYEIPVQDLFSHDMP